MSYNRPKWLKIALDSIYNQTLKPTQITVLDNGSSPDIIKNFSPLIKEGLIWKSAPTQSNFSPQWNFNRAFTDKGYDFIYVMHDDDILLPEFLENQINFLKRNKKCIAVSCGAQTINNQGIAIGNFQFPEQWQTGPEQSIWLNSPPETALFYSKYFVPFPTIVYKKPFPKPETIRNENSKVWDVMAICELSNLGSICYRNIELVKCRVHPGQETTKLNNKTAQIMENYLLKTTIKKPLFFTRVLSQVFKNRIKRQLKNTYFMLKRIK